MLLLPLHVVLLLSLQRVLLLPLQHEVRWQEMLLQEGLLGWLQQEQELQRQEEPEVLLLLLTARPSQHQTSLRGSRRLGQGMHAGFQTKQKPWGLRTPPGLQGTQELPPQPP